MRAIVSSSSGPVLREVATPAVKPGMVLVRIRAGALNRADLAMLKGAPHGQIGGLGAPLGLEWAGEVVEVGQGAERWKVGDRVMGAGGGGLAEFALGFPPAMYAVPEGLSFEEAATLPVALQTMHDAIVTNGRMEAGQSVLFQGASSGVGIVGMQVAKYLGAGLVIGTSTTGEKRDRLAEFGADLVLDTTTPDWVEKIGEATGGKGVDLTIDFLAGPLMNGNLKATRIGGRIVNVGRMAGNSGELDFDLHSMRRIEYVGVTFRTRSLAEVLAVIRKTETALGAALAEGKLRLPVDKVFSLEDASLAYERMAQNKHFGKIVVATA